MTGSRLRQSKSTGQCTTDVVLLSSIASALIDIEGGVAGGFEI